MIWLLALLLCAGSSWFVALFFAAQAGRGDLVFRLWVITGCWFAVSAAALIFAPDDRLPLLWAALVAVSVAGSFVVDELIERRW